MKKLFIVEAKWGGEDKRSIVADSYDEAIGVIDDTNHKPEDFIFEDDSFTVEAVREMTEEERGEYGRIA